MGYEGRKVHTSGGTEMRRKGNRAGNRKIASSPPEILVGHHFCHFPNHAAFDLRFCSTIITIADVQNHRWPLPLFLFFFSASLPRCHRRHRRLLVWFFRLRISNGSPPLQLLHLSLSLCPSFLLSCSQQPTPLPTYRKTTITIAPTHVVVDLRCCSTIITIAGVQNNLWPLPLFLLFFSASLPRRHRRLPVWFFRLRISNGSPPLQLLHLSLTISLPLLLCFLVVG